MSLDSSGTASDGISGGADLGTSGGTTSSSGPASGMARDTAMPSSNGPSSSLRSSDSSSPGPKLLSTTPDSTTAITNDNPSPSAPIKSPASNTDTTAINTKLNPPPAVEKAPVAATPPKDIANPAIETQTSSIITSITRTPSDTSNKPIIVPQTSEIPKKTSPPIVASSPVETPPVVAPKPIDTPVKKPETARPSQIETLPALAQPSPKTFATLKLPELNLGGTAIKRTIQNTNAPINVVNTPNPVPVMPAFPNAPIISKIPTTNVDRPTSSTLEPPVSTPIADPSNIPMATATPHYAAPTDLKIKNPITSTKSAPSSTGPPAPSTLPIIFGIFCCVAVLVALMVLRRSKHKSANKSDEEFAYNNKNEGSTNRTEFTIGDASLSSIRTSEHDIKTSLNSSHAFDSTCKSIGATEANKFIGGAKHLKLRNQSLGFKKSKKSNESDLISAFNTTNASSLSDLSDYNEKLATINAYKNANLTIYETEVSANSREYTPSTAKTVTIDNSLYADSYFEESLYSESVVDPSLFNYTVYTKL